MKIKPKDLVWNTMWPKHQYAMVLSVHGDYFMGKLSQTEGGYRDAMIIQYKNPENWIVLDKRTLRPKEEKK